MLKLIKNSINKKSIPIENIDGLTFYLLCENIKIYLLNNYFNVINNGINNYGKTKKVLVKIIQKKRTKERELNLKK